MVLYVMIGGGKANISPYIPSGPGPLNLHTCSEHAAIINPWRACAARVTVVVLCVCMCVCMYVCMCVHSYLPPHTLESQKRDTNGLCAIQGSF